MSKLKTALSLLREKGPGSIFRITFFRLFPNTIPEIKIIKNAIKNKAGIEIGGPSWIFKDFNYIPIYKWIGSLDGCNFSQTTIWEGSIEKNSPYWYYRNKYGKQFINEASDLSFIPDETYDFIITSHCLEHIANPMKALSEWIRIIKRNGYFLIVVPNKAEMFDHNRDVTSFEHILDDYKNNTSEQDMTHLDEILSLHDLKLDPKAGTFENFKNRSLSNFKNRALHHHVFDTVLLNQILNKFDVEVLFTRTNTDHIVFGKRK